MDELFGGMGSGFRVSMKDSIMMDILHSAMNKAHEKMKFKEGVLERLIEIYKFYELAVMELEGCLRIVQQETDSFDLETKHEEVLSDLFIIRDRLQGRLEETEVTILNKDRELTEKLENESLLKQALELKERELASFHDTTLDPRKTKSGGLDEIFMSSDRLSGDEGREGEICELKNSVEQKVWSFKKKFLDGRMSLTGEMRKLDDPDSEMIDEAKYSSPDNKKIERMGLDIDYLKETLDLAFEKMQNRIFLSEVEPTEKRWRWNIEKDIVSTVTRGFVRDSHERFEPKESKHEKTVGFLAENWSDLMKEITSLRRELEPIGCQNEVQVKSIKSREQGKSDQNSMKDENVDQMEEHLGEDPNGDESRYVAKMIKNHESIIRQKSEEMKWLWLKGEILQEKGGSSLRRDTDYCGLKERIQEVIVRLDSLITWNAKLAENFGDYSAEEGLSESDSITEKEKMGVDSSAPFCQKFDNVSASNTMDENLHDEMKQINQELEDANLVTMILEETYFVLFRGMMENFNIKSYNLETDDLVREEIYGLVFNETVKNIVDNANSSLSRYEREKDPEIFPHDFPSTSEVACLVKEDVYMAFLKEMVKEWKMEVDAYDTENTIREDIYRFVIVEGVKDAYVLLKDSEAQQHGSFSEELLFDNNIVEVSGEEESLILKLDCLLKCCEEEELDKWVISEEFSTEEESDFSSISIKLEKALQQLSTSKTLLSELGSSFGTTVSDLDKVHDPTTRPRDFVTDGENSFCQQKQNEEGKLNQAALFVCSPLMEFSQVFADFECKVHEKIGLSMSRLQELKHQHDQLSELVASVKERETRYKKAFIRRSHNLQKAEAEVDLLGDQVDVLLGLLEKIYVTLQHYSPILQQYFGVSDILRLIKKELTAGAAQVTD